MEPGSMYPKVILLEATYQMSWVENSLLVSIALNQVNFAHIGS
jgi:hypothetical protein